MTAQDYGGHVEPGGAAISRTVRLPGGEVEVRKLSVPPLDNNVYILRDLATDAALLIDAANEADRLLEELDGLDVTAIVTTHGHGDHWQALDRVATETGATTYLHPGDAHLVRRRADEPIGDGMEVAFGNAAVHLVHTAGHTPGSVCVLLGDRHLFTGDTLFPGGPGATRRAADFRTIMTSLRERLFVLDDETWVYPGHGDDTTLGAERPFLGEWEERGW